MKTIMLIENAAEANKEKVPEFVTIFLLLTGKYFGPEALYLVMPCHFCFAVCFSSS